MYRINQRLRVEHCQALIAEFDEQRKRRAELQADENEVAEGLDKVSMAPGAEEKAP